MAIFGQLSRDEIRRDFTHYGLMFGFVPVYIGDPESEAPRVCVRNWWPEWLLDAAQALFDVCVAMKTAADPFYEPMFPMVLTGEIT